MPPLRERDGAAEGTEGGDGEVQGIPEPCDHRPRQRFPARGGEGQRLPDRRAADRKNPGDDLLHDIQARRAHAKGDDPDRPGQVHPLRARGRRPAGFRLAGIHVHLRPDPSRQGTGGIHPEAEKRGHGPPRREAAGRIRRAGRFLQRDVGFPEGKDAPDAGGGTDTGEGQPGAEASAGTDGEGRDDGGHRHPLDGDLPRVVHPVERHPEHDPAHQAGSRDPSIPHERPQCHRVRGQPGDQDHPEPPRVRPVHQVQKGSGERQPDPGGPLQNHGVPAGGEIHNAGSGNGPPSQGDPCEFRADAPGLPEHHPERDPGDGEHGGAAGCDEELLGRYRAGGGGRHRRYGWGDPAGPGQADLPALLYDQGGGDRAGAGHRIRNHPGAQRQNRGREQGRGRIDVPGLYPRRQRSFGAGMNRTILVVEDDRNLSLVLSRVLQKEGYEVAVANTVTEGKSLLTGGTPGLVLTDVYLPDGTGLEILESAKSLNGGIDVIVMTANATVESAIAAMKKGAHDYLLKPFQVDELVLHVKKIFERRTLISENLYLKEDLKSRYRFADLIGRSPRMQELFDLMAKVKESGSSVLIEGESGTGKELIARAIHFQGARADKMFVPINCSAIPENLLESELFGHVKGAYTGASENKKGLFEYADQGTLFLDEIGDLSKMLQAKLLRVLQDGRMRRVGEYREVEVDVRILAATNKDLHKLIKNGDF